MTPADLRTRRLSLGLTQRQLAESLGVAPNSVARWERGEMGMARPRMIELCMEAMGKNKK